MGFGKGTKREAEISVKRYIGIAAVKVLGLNPTAAEQNKLFNSNNFTTDPVYVGTAKSKNSKNEDIEVPQLRLSFVVRTNPEIACNNGIDVTLTAPSLFLTKNAQYSFKDGVTKMKVIDEYGRTAWATAEDVQNKAIPVYSNGPARITTNYRPALIGEEELTVFLKKLLGIPSAEMWDGEKYVMRPAAELDECKCRIDNINNLFSGNVSEIKEYLSYQPNNLIKLLLGVKTSDDGKQYQAVYTRDFISIGTTNYKTFEAKVKEAQNAGAYTNTVFEVCNLKEFVFTPTEYKPSDAPQNAAAAFNSSSFSDLPFGN